MKRSSNWIIGIGGVHTYRVGNVTYEVSSKFASPDKPAQEMTLHQRMERGLCHTLTRLTAKVRPDTMAPEYVCSAAGKED